MRQWTIVLCVIALLLGGSVRVEASIDDDATPYMTYTMGPNQSLIRTQTAYVPAGFFAADHRFVAPTDMVFYDGWLWVLDAGAQHVIAFDEDGNVQKMIADTSWVEPTGLDVFNDTLYIADRGLREVRTYDFDGTFRQRFGRPTEPIFGQNSPYVPRRVTVGPRGNLFVVGEGSTSGVIQLSSRGEFLGFFGTNLTSLSWLQRIANLLDVQFALNIPTSATNLALDNQGSLYTISPTDSKPLKRFNIASVDTLDVSFFTENLISLAVSDMNNIYTLSSTGVITEYDQEGRMIFSFGGLDTTGALRQGLLVTPIDIEVSNNRHLFVLDEGLNRIVVYVPTAFTRSIHEGLIAFNEGIYDTELWEDVLRFNEIFALANQAIGQANYRLNRFEEALQFFQLAQFKEGYSNAYWQLRYRSIQSFLPWVMSAIVASAVFSRLFKYWHRRHPILEPAQARLKTFTHQPSIYPYRLFFTMLRHPIDTLYDIKHRQRSSVRAASVIYLIFIALTVVTTVGTAFLFQQQSLTEFSLLRHVFGVSIAIIFIVFSNYLIATLNDGEGWFKDVYIGMAYALAPFVVLALPLTVLSYGLTLFELFIYQFLWFVTISWTVIYVLITLKEIHGYSVSALLKNVFLTLVTVAVLILLTLITYLLLNQVVDYVLSIIREVLARV